MSINSGHINSNGKVSRATFFSLVNFIVSFFVGMSNPDLVARIFSCNVNKKKRKLKTSAWAYKLLNWPVSMLRMPATVSQIMMWRAVCVWLCPSSQLMFSHHRPLKFFSSFVKEHLLRALLSEVLTASPFNLGFGISPPLIVKLWAAAWEWN